MRLQYLPANNAWAFTWNDDLVPLAGERRFFTSHEDAVKAAAEHGLVVHVNGIVVTVDQFTHEHGEHRLAVPVGSVRPCSCGAQVYVADARRRAIPGTGGP